MSEAIESQLRVLIFNHIESVVAGVAEIIDKENSIKFVSHYPQIEDNLINGFPEALLDHVDNFIDYSHYVGMFISEYNFSDLTEFSAVNLDAGEEQSIYDADSIASYIISQSSEYYLFRKGHETIDYSFLNNVCLLFAKGNISDELKVSFIVPILNIRFEESRYRLPNGINIIKLGPEILKSRSYSVGNATGVLSVGTGFASHGILFSGVTAKLPRNPVSRMMSVFSDVDIFDEYLSLFFMLLQMHTSVDVGYSHVLQYPRKWVTQNNMDLMSCHSFQRHQYRPDMDSYFLFGDDGEPEKPQILTSAEVYSISSMMLKFNDLTPKNRTRMLRAARRYNSSGTRSNPEDRIFDYVIVLEMLLSDGDKDSLSYKLRMRLAALTKSFPDGAVPPPSDVLSYGREIYDSRSKIVHGDNPKKDVGETSIKAKFCADLVLSAMFNNPSLLNPFNIDQLLFPPVTDETSDNLA